VGSYIDLLRGVTEGPPEQAVHGGIDMADPAHRPHVGRDQDYRTHGNGEDRNDSGCQCTEGDQRDRALIGFFFLGDYQGALRSHSNIPLV